MANVKNIFIGIAGLIVLGFVAEHRENGITPVIILLSITMTFGVAWYINKAKGIQRQPIATETQIRLLREKIIGYRPGEWTLRDVTDEFQKPPKIRLGVVGVADSGKSSFLNSLHFALTGTWRQVYAEKSRQAPGGETMFRGFMKLTDHVTTADTRGISDVHTRRVNDTMAEISGNRGIDPSKRHKGEEIDCPIFVVRYRCETEAEIKAHIGFLEVFIAQSKKRFGAYPIMVITFKDSIAKKEEILYEICMTGMQKSNVFFIENYTEEHHEMDSERHVALLKILDVCILRADDNITFQWCKEKEIPWWKKL